jgi:hypothetical protein
MADQDRRRGERRGAGRVRLPRVTSGPKDPILPVLFTAAPVLGLTPAEVAAALDLGYLVTPANRHEFTVAEGATFHLAVARQEREHPVVRAAHVPGPFRTPTVPARAGAQVPPDPVSRALRVMLALADAGDLDPSPLHAWAALGYLVTEQNAALFTPAEREMFDEVRRANTSPGILLAEVLSSILDGSSVAGLEEAIAALPGPVPVRRALLLLLRDPGLAAGDLTRALDWVADTLGPDAVSAAIVAAAALVGGEEERAASGAAGLRGGDAADARDAGEGEPGYGDLRGQLILAAGLVAVCGAGDPGWLTRILTDAESERTDRVYRELLVVLGEHLQRVLAGVLDGHVTPSTLDDALDLPLPVTLPNEPPDALGDHPRMLLDVGMSSVLSGWVAGALAVGCTMDDALDWVSIHQGPEAAAMAVAIAGTFGASQVRDTPPADAAGLRRGILPGLVWLVAGMVARHGEGDPVWLLRVRARLDRNLMGADTESVVTVAGGQLEVCLADSLAAGGVAPGAVQDLLRDLAVVLATWDGPRLSDDEWVELLAEILVAWVEGALDGASDLTDEVSWLADTAGPGTAQDALALAARLNWVPSGSAAAGTDLRVLLCLASAVCATRGMPPSWLRQFDPPGVVPVSLLVGVGDHLEAWLVGVVEHDPAAAAPVEALIDHLVAQFFAEGDVVGDRAVAVATVLGVTLSWMSGVSGMSRVSASEMTMGEVLSWVAEAFGAQQAQAASAAGVTFGWVRSPDRFGAQRPQAEELVAGLLYLLAGVVVTHMHGETRWLRDFDLG